MDGGLSASQAPRGRRSPSAQGVAESRGHGHEEDGAIAKAAHHSGDYQARAQAVRDQANANPDTLCWRCRRTLADHPPHTNGKPARWTAGHVIDSDPTSPLAPEASTCNFSAGAATGNRRRSSGYSWP